MALEYISPLSRCKNCIEEKYAWLEKYIGKDFTKRVILSKNKTPIGGDILIDDKSAITDLLNPTWEHIVFNRPWNRAIADKEGSLSKTRKKD